MCIIIIIILRYINSSCITPERGIITQYMPSYTRNTYTLGAVVAIQSPPPHCRWVWIRTLINSAAYIPRLPVNRPPDPLLSAVA